MSEEALMGRETADWVIVVDDDIINLKTAGYFLSEAPRTGLPRI